jgi:hypothetical protein
MENPATSGSRTVYVILALGGAFLSGILLSARGISASNDKVSDDGGLDGIVKQLRDDIDNLKRYNPPVGSVSAYSGEWPPTDARGVVQDEAKIGWILCDGRNLDKDEYAELRRVLKQATAPDYRGYFLRGSDAGSKRDPERHVGTTQDWATGMPKKKFGTNTVPDHTHDLSLSVRQNDGDNDKAGSEVTVHNKFWSQQTSAKGNWVKPSGSHSHQIDGGDIETRPINVAVHWIIKFK